LCSEKSLHVAAFCPPFALGFAVHNPIATRYNPPPCTRYCGTANLCLHPQLIASLLHRVNTLVISTILCTRTQQGITTFVCVQRRLLRFGRDRYAGVLRCALIFLHEVHINDESMLRYDYKEFSAALGKRVKQLRKERGLTLRALVVQHGFHLTQIQRIEKGDGLSVPTLLRIAEVFQIPVEKLTAGLGLVEGAESRSKSSKK
jgi:hypothetical protein